MSPEEEAYRAIFGETVFEREIRKAWQMIETSYFVSGWNAALKAAEKAIRDCPALDKEGYLCEKFEALKVLAELRSSGAAPRLDE